MSDTIKRMFAPFTDPATPLKCEETSGGHRVFMTCRGEERDYLIRASDGSIEECCTHKKFANLRSLLASSDFADLRGFATTQVRVYTELSFDDGIAPEIEVFRDGNLVASGRKTVMNEMVRASEGKLGLTLLDGPAGVGKTSFSKSVTKELAERFLAGEDVAPMLYVSSHGKRISSLLDCLAASTQILKANFTFEQVPILVKMRLLYVLIDGFDELVDSDGYQDAWYALKGFLEELGTSGRCVLVGRDTFFDQQRFLKRLESARAYDFTQVHLKPVTPERARGWLLTRGFSEDDVDGDIGQAVLANSYCRRPFVLSEIGEIGDWNELASHNSIFDFLVGRFLDREAGLLNSSLGIDLNVAKKALEKLFKEIALDMAERESTEVDLEFIDILCEAILQDMIDMEAMKKLKHKAGSIGLLERCRADNRREFPHSELLNFFLSHGIIDELLGEQIPLVLRRGVLGADFFRAYQKALEGYPISQAIELFERLKGRLQTERSHDRFGANAGGLLVSTITRERENEESWALEDLEVNECVFAMDPAASRISSSTIGVMDAVDVDLSSVNFQDCHVSILIGNAATRFGTSIPRVTRIHDMSVTREPVLNDPTRISAWLERHKSTGGDGSANAVPMLEFLDKILRKALVRFYFCESDDDPSAAFLNDEKWPAVEEVLVRHGRMLKETKAKGGRSLPFVHIKNARGLLCPSSDDMESIEARAEISKL